MNEKQYKDKLGQAMRAEGFDVERHEDKFRSYIPDISFAIGNTDGWIEVKYIDEIFDPKMILKLEHLTPGQIRWLQDRGNSGSGHCYLLIGFADKHLLVHYQKVKFVKGMNADSASWHSQMVVTGGVREVAVALARYLLDCTT